MIAESNDVVESDNNVLPSNCGSKLRHFSSIFASSKAGLTGLSISVLLSFGIVITVGVVPEVLADRYARLYHGYSGEERCSSFSDHNLMPQACRDGADDAQTGSAWGSMVMNMLTFYCNPVIGSQSDIHGRRGPLLMAISLFMLSPIALVTLQRIPTMDPAWFYAADSTTGLVNFMSLIFASMSDCMPEEFRAASFAAIMAGFYCGYAVGPSLSLLMSHEAASWLSCVLCVAAFLFAVAFFPETLPERVASVAAINHHPNPQNNSTVQGPFSSDEGDHEGGDMQETYAGRGGCFHCTPSSLMLFILRPFRDISILNRSSVMRLVTLGSFLSATVYMTDRTLVVFYIEENLNVRDADIAKMFFILGLLGVLFQGIGLQPLIHCLGERGLLILSFWSGTFHNALYGLARNKAAIYVALSFSQLTKLNYPVLSSIASSHVLPSEQGQIQGALFALNALAGAIGPLCMNAVYDQTKDGPLGPGAMFLLASFLYFLGTISVYMIPATIDTRTLSSEGGVREEGMMERACDTSDSGGLGEPLLASRNSEE
jgi:DHA1 family tetracycline resistance protein-like MFS transporter